MGRAREGMLLPPVLRRMSLGNPAMKPQVEALQSWAVEGADGATSAWVADESNCVLGRELSLGEKKRHVDLAHEGKLRELAAWKSLMFVRNETRVTCRRELRKPNGFLVGRWLIGRNASRRAR